MPAQDQFDRLAPVEAVSVIVAASDHTIAPALGGTIPALAALNGAVAKAFEGSLGLAATSTPEMRARDGRADDWEWLGEAILELGAATLRVLRVFTPPEAIEEQLMRPSALLAQAEAAWQDARNERTALAMWSKRVRERLLEAMSCIAAHDHELASIELMIVLALCVQAVVWLNCPDERRIGGLEPGSSGTGGAQAEPGRAHTAVVPA